MDKMTALVKLIYDLYPLAGADASRRRQEYNEDPVGFLQRTRYQGMSANEISTVVQFPEGNQDNIRLLFESDAPELFALTAGWNLNDTNFNDDPKRVGRYFGTQVARNERWGKICVDNEHHKYPNPKAEIFEVRSAVSPYNVVTAIKTNVETAVTIHGQGILKTAWVESSSSDLEVVGSMKVTGSYRCGCIEATLLGRKAGGYKAFVKCSVRGATIDIGEVEMEVKDTV